MILIDLMFFIVLCFLIMFASYFALSAICGLFEFLEKKGEKDEDGQRNNNNDC